MKRVLTFILLTMFAFLFSCQSQKKEKTQLSPDEFEAQMNTESIVLDVRTPEEYAREHIKNAQNINFYDRRFSENLQKLDKNKSYLVYCQSGGRSLQAIKTMKKMKFLSVSHLQGGILAWKKMKKNLVK